MKFGIGALETLPWATRIAFEDQEAQIQAGWEQQHDGDGGHKDITAFSVDTVALTHGGPLGMQNDSTTVLSPTLSAAANNWNADGWLTTALVRWTTSGASRTLTGVQRPAVGGVFRRVLFMNIGGQNLVLSHEDTLSVAGNRFRCPGAANFTLNPSDAVWLCYDQISERWQVEAV